MPPVPETQVEMSSLPAPGCVAPPKVCRPPLVRTLFTTPDDGAALPSSPLPALPETVHPREEPSAGYVPPSDYCLLCLREAEFVYDGHRHWKFCDKCYNSCDRLEREIVLRTTHSTEGRFMGTAPVPSGSDITKLKKFKGRMSLVIQIDGCTEHLNVFIDGFSPHMRDMVIWFMLSGTSAPECTIRELQNFCTELKKSSALQLYLCGHILFELLGSPKFRTSEDHYETAQERITYSVRDIFLNRIRYIMGFQRREVHAALDPNLLSILNSEQKPRYTDPRNISKHFLSLDDPNYERYRKEVFCQHQLGWPGFMCKEDAIRYFERMPLTHDFYRFIDPETFDTVGYVVGILDPTGKAYRIPAPSGHVIDELSVLATTSYHDKPGFL